MSKNGWFSSAQAPNPRPVSDVSNALQAINNKLDMILDALTKPAEKVELPQATITVKPENMSPDTKAFLDHWANNPPRIGPSRPAALDVDDEYCSMKMPKGTEEEPKRTNGKTAIQQINNRIEEYWGGMQSVRLKTANGLVTATLNNVKPRECNYYTHVVKVTDKVAKTEKKDKHTIQPTIFGITEAREVVAYLESLGVKVNTNALNRV